MTASPFTNLTDQPIVALCGPRNGYLQIAPSIAVERYHELPLATLAAAKAWAAILESQGAERVYWITMSEMVRHLHIHLYPRWPEDTHRGLDLFNRREEPLQPVWTQAVNEALAQWTNEYQVYVVAP